MSLTDSSLTISCVKTEMSSVVLSDCLLTRRPSLGRWVTMNVIIRFEVLLMSLVPACKSSFVSGREEPGEIIDINNNLRLFYLFCLYGS